MHRYKLLWIGLIFFLVVNVVAYNHAYQFTHFTGAVGSKIPNAYELSGPEKIKALFWGVATPRPTNKKLPPGPYKLVKLKSNKLIAGWLMQVPAPKGTVILFHGYGGEKSGLLANALTLQKLGYSTFLVDFMGSGESAGNQTTIGFHEAAQVETCFTYIQQHLGGKIYLFGTSMGAVAILKALQDYPLQPSGIILECPFSSLYETTCARFRLLHIPSFPFAGLLLFWGSVQNNFWAFSHNPTTYAQAVTCPVLLLYGEQDPKVSRPEINQIYANLNGPKQLKTYPCAGHENYLVKYPQKWTSDVVAFLSQY